MKRIFVMLGLFLANLVVFTNPVFAHQPEDGLVHASFGPYVFQTQALHNSFYSPPSMGWALIAEGDLNKYGGLELTAIYMDPIFVVGRDQGKVIEKVKRMYIAMGYRHWFNPEISVSPSFFSSYVMGDAKVVKSDFARENTPDTSARDPVDYGFALSVQYEFLRSHRFAALLDARYSYSVTPKSREDSNVYGGIIAFKYFIQARQPQDD